MTASPAHFLIIFDLVGAPVSWVSDVILLANLAEIYSDGEYIEEPKAITGINRWLEKGNWAPLVSLSDKLCTEKAFQACAYGGALNRLDVPGFLKIVAEQQWQSKVRVMLLIKNEDEEAFTPYRLNSTGTVLKIM
jgi:hypothetical protein